MKSNEKPCSLAENINKLSYLRTNSIKSLQSRQPLSMMIAVPYMTPWCPLFDKKDVIYFYFSSVFSPRALPKLILPTKRKQ